MKTTHFHPAHLPLTGAELIGVTRPVDDAYATYRITAGQIQYKAHESYIQFGPAFYGGAAYSINIGITIANESSVAIGHYTAVFGYRAVGIGLGDNADFYSVSIGNGAGCDEVGVSIGSNVDTNGQFAIAIGNELNNIRSGSVAIGYSVPGGETHSVGIGFRPNLYGSPGEFEPGGIAIGNYAAAHFNGGLAIGDQTHAQLRSLAIGASAVAYSAHAVALGNGAEVGLYSNYGTAIGTASIAARLGTAIGYQSRAGVRGFAAGRYANAPIDYAIAIGYRNYGGQSRVTIGAHVSAPTAQDSMAIGSYGPRPLADGELAFGVRAWGGGMQPATRFQRFRTHTQAATPARVSWSSFAGFTATITNNTPGAAGNNYSLEIVYNDAPNVTLTPSLSGTVITIVIGTASNNLPDGGQNTLQNLAIAISNNSDLDGFTFSYTDGFDAFVFHNGLTLPYIVNFAGGQEVINGVFQTGALSSNVIPAIPHQAIGTVYGRITGADVNYAVGYATFGLAPTLFFTDTEGQVTFINEPVFSVENGNETGQDWSVPVLTTDGSGLALQVDAPSNVDDTLIYWIAHLTFDASN